MHYSKLFLRTQVCHAACYHGPVFVVKFVLYRSAASAGAGSTLFLRLRPHLDLFPLGVHSATIRIAHLLCPILFSYDLAPSLGDSQNLINIPSVARMSTSLNRSESSSTHQRVFASLTQTQTGPVKSLRGIQSTGMHATWLAQRR